MHNYSLLMFAVTPWAVVFMTLAHIRSVSVFNELFGMKQQNKPLHRESQSGMHDLVCLRAERVKILVLNRFSATEWLDFQADTLRYRLVPSPRNSHVTCSYTKRTRTEIQVERTLLASSITLTRTTGYRLANKCLWPHGDEQDFNKNFIRNVATASLFSHFREL